MQTTFAKQEAVKRNWYFASAKGRVLGPLATQIAVVLMGKTRPDWTPSTDSGDYVVVTEVENLVFTGRKIERKKYRFHSGYMGGITELSLGTLHAKKPEMILQLAVKRMLPKTIQGRHQLKRLKVFKGAAHGHTSQKPLPLPE
ncbi:MAG: 50S ribosomal protein L13 [Planctomycetes bacterium]|nr:50S ribosomal protein L13 [Planctomycetota bacterium]